ncbi:protein FAM8A1-like [Acropora palmata]|uniref:protein FAM8A1-like n=1 Tax=Acropora palmata TaxID=6131 RepID=UPI003DA094A9
MADNIVENDNSHEENPPTAMGKSQNTESASSQYGSNNYFLQQNTALSQSQEPWTVLWYWLSAQYYQQYCYQLYSYAHYWQTVASQAVYQGALQPQSSYSQPGLNNQGYEAARIGQHPQRNENNEQINHGVGLLQGMAAPWLFPGQQTVTTACEVYIAPISKRVYAELLDFVFLYLTKVLVLSIFYDDLERYNKLQYMLITNDAASLKVIEELLIQALVYRLMVFAYEVFFLMGGLGGSVGGATPGKYLMGLSAIASDSVTTILTDAEGKKVRIMPGGNLGFWRSFTRALVKNCSMTFLFPVFLTVLFFQHNRTIYDVISNSTIVVNSSTRPRPQANQHRQF